MVTADSLTLLTRIRWDCVKIKSGKGESVRILCDDPGMLITFEYTTKDTILDVTWYYQPQVCIQQTRLLSA